MADKVYVFLADGFEEIEGLTVVDVLRRGGVDLSTVSITQSRTIHGSHGIDVEADELFSEADLEAGTLYVLPGGMPGTLHLGEKKELCELLVRSKGEGKRIAAICAAPSVLGDLGLLDGERATCHPGFEERLKGATVLTDEVVVSGQMTTSRGMGTAIAFALSLLATLKGQEVADKVAQAMVYRQ